MSNFREASRQKLRVETNKGLLAVEQLWDLSLTDLDQLAVRLEAEYKESGKKSFLVSGSKKDKKTKLTFDIVIEILTTKVDEAEVSKNAGAIKQNNEKIMALIADKQEDSLKNMSVEELKTMLK